MERSARAVGPLVTCRCARPCSEVHVRCTSDGMIASQLATPGATLIHTSVNAGQPELIAPATPFAAPPLLNRPELCAHSALTGLTSGSCGSSTGGGSCVTGVPPPDDGRTVTDAPVKPPRPA